MKKVLEIFTCPPTAYVGGVGTMVNSYMSGVIDFAKGGCELTHLNILPKVNTGNSKVDNIIYIFTQRREVRKHLRTNRYDVIHIHTSREFLFFKDLLLAKMINQEYHIPIVMTIHVGAMETVYNRISWFKDRSISLMNRFISMTIFLSKEMREEFIRDGLSSKKSSVLYNFHNFAPTYKVPEKSEELQLLFVGAIHREKGIMELLHAIKQLPDLKCHLNICGQLTDNSIKNEVELFKDNLSDRVSFLGYVSGEDKTLLYKQSDILILPSYHEGLPLVILEALGAGCGIISTKVGAIPEILDDKNAIWVRISSDEDIVKALLSVQNNKDLLEKQKMENRQLGLEYSFSAHVAKLSHIYNTI